MGEQEQPSQRHHRWIFLLTEKRVKKQVNIGDHANEGLRLKLKLFLIPFQVSPLKRLYSTCWSLMRHCKDWPSGKHTEA